MAPPRRPPLLLALLVVAPLLSATAAAATNAKMNGLNFLNGQWSSQAKYDSPQALA